MRYIQTSHKLNLWYNMDIPKKVCSIPPVLFHGSHHHRDGFLEMFLPCAGAAASVVFPESYGNLVPMKCLILSSIHRAMIVE
mmetsp:Transcript_22099/g.34711  ORF Transcript_22099/g.34711 Transcript_22099/m.34711 type:complete len:82 (-) Transcript_22099:437-682(-)